jgi:hypothetical protein
MNPHSILIVIEKSNDDDTTRRGEWSSLTQAIRNVLSKEKGTEILAENVFLIPLQNGLKALNCVLDLSRDFHYPCKAVFLEKEADWICYPSKSNPRP